MEITIPKKKEKNDKDERSKYAHTFIRCVNFQEFSPDAKPILDGVDKLRYCLDILV